MDSKTWQGVLPAYVLSCGIFVLDQVTKMIVEATMAGPGVSVEIIGFLDFFRLTYVINPGAAWGILPGFQWLFIIVALLVSAVCIWAIQSKPHHPVRYAWSCVLGGGLGNMVDRMFTEHGVVDFFDMGIFGYRWPTYNIADASLTIGMVWLGYQILIVEGMDGTETSDEDDDSDD